MNEEVVAHMRTRIQRMREIIKLAHDPGMIEMLEQTIAEAEADIRKLEQDRDSEAEARR